MYEKAEVKHYIDKDEMSEDGEGDGDCDGGRNNADMGGTDLSTSLPEYMIVHYIINLVDFICFLLVIWIL